MGEDCINEPQILICIVKCMECRFKSIVLGDMKVLSSLGKIDKCINAYKGIDCFNCGSWDTIIEKIPFYRVENLNKIKKYIREE